MAGPPPTSNNNYGIGGARANMALVPAAASGVCVYVSGAAHVIVDVQGELRDDATAMLQIVRPTRVQDTRTPR